jgi:16S rRNA (adenine1518-N6/adenine1519-N6)-dimethyltransferase
VIDAIIDAAQIEKNDLVIEVGPGAGALTQALPFEKGESEGVILIEADRELLPHLSDRFPSAKILHADAAQVDYDALTNGRPWIFVSNLPYNAGNAILETVLRSRYLPKRCVVMVQKEVGERMMASPGDMSLLSVAIQTYCAVERVCMVKPDAFTPPPKVDSIVLRFVPHSIPDLARSYPEQVIALARIGFAHRRKQLRSTLVSAGVAPIDRIDAVFARLHLSSTVRPQELSVVQWRKMNEELS